MVRLRPLLAALAAATIASWVGPAAAAGGRAALVIAEADYPDSDAALPTPVADGRALADELRRRSFTVTTAENAGKDALRATIDTFVRTVEPNGVAMVYFAGFGIQAGRRNYLIPVDAHIWNETDVARDGVAVDGLMDEIGKRGAAIRVVVLDASRRNPFERRFRAFSQGLAPAAAPTGSLVMSVAAAGGVVGDGAGPRSPFGTELVRQIGTDQSADRAFAAVRDAIARRTNNGQVPALVENLDETFYFDPDRPRIPVGKEIGKQAGKAEGTTDASTRPQVAQTQNARAQEAGDAERDRKAREEKARTEATAGEQARRDFDAARAKGTAGSYRDFLDRHPAGPLADQARGEMNRLDAREATAFDEAEAKGTAAAYRDFLDRYPSGPRADAARGAQDHLAAAERRRAEGEQQRLSDLDERIRKNPSDEAAYYERGQFHAQRGEATAAIADFDESIRLNPTSPESYNNRCWTRAMADDLKRALADCDQALKLRPGFLDALDSRGLVNLKAGAWRSAVTDYGEALRLDPRHSSALYGRGLARRRLGEEASAGRDLDSALQLNPQIGSEFASYGLR